MTVKERLKQIESDELPEDYKLHQILELAMTITGEGHVSDDYTKFIEFEIGGITVFSDPYYQRVQIDEQDLNQEQIRNLTSEIKKRILAFDRKTHSARKKAAKDVFQETLGNIIEN
ncbi:hypothetical protein HYU12_01775 [Candidatus Woesearchaeota archaeon]|nr:hypothetical protein [Candidatus Woesearchaeota archaeon]